MKRLPSIAAAFVLVASLPVLAGDWPGFRGPAGTGVSDETGLPTNWSKTENVKWRIALPADGNSSPIVSNGRVFVTSASSDGKERSLICFDRKDGRQLWEKTVGFDKVEPTHKTNPYGASTPAADGKRVVVWHGSAGLNCYDFEGKELWSLDLGDASHIWGYASSPVISGNNVYLNFGPGKQTFMAGIDMSAGKAFWTHEEAGGNNDRNGRMVGSWSTPVLAEVDGKQQLICSMPTRVVAYNPEGGELLWSCKGLSGKNGDLVYTSPLIGEGIGVAMGGYTGPAIGFKLGGSGDITETGRLWHNTKGNPQRIGSGVIIGKYVYMANAGPGYLQCIDAETGKETWRDRGPGGNHWGAIVYADGRLYVTNQKGSTLVFKPNPEKFESIATNDLGETSNSTPAVSDGEIFIRTFKALYCIADGSKAAGK